MNEEKLSLLDLASAILHRIPVLVRLEMKLLQAELLENLERQLRAAALVGVAVFLGLIAVLLFVGAGVAALARVLGVWGAFLASGAGLALLAGGLAWLGVRRLGETRLGAPGAVAELLASRDWLLLRWHGLLGVFRRSPAAADAEESDTAAEPATAFAKD